MTKNCYLLSSSNIHDGPSIGSIPLKVLAKSSKDSRARGVSDSSKTAELCRRLAELLGLDGVTLKGSEKLIKSGKNGKDPENPQTIRIKKSRKMEKNSKNPEKIGIEKVKKN